MTLSLAPRGLCGLNLTAPPGLSVQHQQSPAETQKAQAGESVPLTGAALNISQTKEPVEQRGGVRGEQFAAPFPRLLLGMKSAGRNGYVRLLT